VTTRSKPAPARARLDQRRADAVQRRVRDRQPGAVDRRLDLQRQHGREVVGLEGCADRLHQAGGPGGGQLGHLDRPRRRVVDRRRDGAVDRRDDLRAVAPVHLVAVVLGRVVAGGHHHAGRGAERAHRVGGDRRRPVFVREPHGDPGGGQHRGGLLGELPRLVARVVTDHDAAGRRVGDRGHQVRGQAGGHLAHLQLVHALRPGGQHPADAGGAELQPAGHALVEVGRGGGVTAGGARDQRGELGLGLGIRIAGRPGPRAVDGGHRARLYTRGASTWTHGRPCTAVGRCRLTAADTDRSHLVRRGTPASPLSARSRCGGTPPRLGQADTPTPHCGVARLHRYM
jgi:hypothetical protein